MKQNTTPARIASVSSTKYSAHRERQRARIMIAARQLFNANGIDRVTMGEIVTATGVRPSTVYEYFTNKNAIVWAIIEACLVESSAYLQERVEHTHGSGLDRIAAVLKGLGEELISHPERVRFHAQFDAMYARDRSADMLIAVEDRVMPERNQSLRAFILEGIQDGSLRSELDPDLTMSAIINAAIATQRRFAALGDRVEKEYGKSPSLLFQEASRLIIEGLRNRELNQPEAGTAKSRRRRNE